MHDLIFESISEFHDLRILLCFRAPYSIYLPYNPTPSLGVNLLSPLELGLCVHSLIIQQATTLARRSLTAASAGGHNINFEID